MNTLEQGLLRYIDPEPLERLRQARVLVIGAGGLGSNVTLMLARSGVGCFILVDHDRVEASNLNRQAYFPADIGKPKVQALADHLRMLNPDICLQCHVEKVTRDNAHAFFDQAEVIVEAVDGAATKAMLCEAAASTEKLYVTASGITGLGSLDSAMRVRRLGTHMFCVGDASVGPDDVSPPFAPRVTQAAAMQANIVLHYLL